MATPALSPRMIFANDKWPHITEHENIHIKISTAIHMENDEANRIRNGNREEGLLRLRQDEPFLAFCITDQSISNNHLTSCVGLSRGLVVSDAVRVVTRRKRDARGEFPQLQSDVSSLNKGEEFGKERVSVEHPFHRIRLAVAVQPEEEA